MESMALATVSSASSVAPVNPSLNQFRQYVTAWIELDKLIHNLQETLKEKRELKVKVTNKIMEFMNVNNVEDVNLNTVKLRYKVVQKRKPTLSRKQILEKLLEDLPESAHTVVQSAFGETSIVDQPTLRKLKISDRNSINMTP